MNTTYISKLHEAEASATGNKFFALSKINEHFAVPAAFCITSEAFEASLSGEAKATIDKCLDMLKNNGGYQLNRLQSQIEEEIVSCGVADSAWQPIYEEARLLTDDWETPLIVRSSSSFEDGANTAGAGIYESFANIRNADTLREAIVYCWKESFSLQALSHRLRIKEYDREPLIALIAQRFVTARLSGVCFSRDPMDGSDRVYVEYTEGSSDGIESGEGAVSSFVAIKSNTGEYIVNNTALDSTLVDELIAISDKLQEQFKEDMEYEWAYDGDKLYVLQTRPITKKYTTKASKDPVYEIYDLYTESSTIDTHNLGLIKPIYQHSINKRKQIRLFALENNILINGSAVGFMNSAGMKDKQPEQHPALSRLNTPIFSIDLGPHLRAFYSKREELGHTLQTLIGHGDVETSSIIREFASGQFSAISMQDGVRILVEICMGSLIGLNRGFVESETYAYDIATQELTKVAGNLSTTSGTYYDFDEDTSTFAFKPVTPQAPVSVAFDAIAAIAAFTVKVNQSFENNILEWTIVDDKPVYVDNTPDPTYQQNKGMKSGGAINFLSPGKLVGTIVRVEDLHKLEYISAGPTLNVSGNLPTLEANKEIQDLMALASKKKNLVIVSKYPYTALSVLIGKVSGFIFESGPILCHLAIVARENNTPVAIVPDALKLYKDGDTVTL